MERKNFNPSTAQQDERVIVRDQQSFSAGGFDDLPGSKIPQNGFKYSKNYVAKKDGTLVVRGGTRKWSTTLIPVLRTGYTLSKTGSTVTKTAGTDFSASDVGRWIIYDNGQVDYIKAYVSTTAVTVASSDALTASVAAKIRDSVWGLWYHSAKSKLVLHIGPYFYVSDANTIAWIRIYGDNQYSPANSASSAVAFKNTLIIFNANGTFIIDLSSTTSFFYRFNTEVPIKIVDGISKTNVNIYGYRYIYTMVRLSGTANNRNRMTSGVNIESESGPVRIGNDYRDYGEIWTSKPVGPSSALASYILDADGVGGLTVAKSYQILTGTTMDAAWNTIAEWKAVTDGQFHITVDGIDHNIVCDFSSVSSWDGIAAVIQEALRDFFSDATCVWSTDHFIIASPHDGGLVTVTSIGDGGTTTLGTVGLACATGQGAVTTYDMEASKTFEATAASSVAADFRCPVDSNHVPDSHWTHYGIYRTLDIGVNGKDPVTGEGNNSEKYVWVADVPIAKGFLCSIARVTTVGTMMTASDTLTEQDVGSLIYVYDTANTAWRVCYIASFTNRTTAVLTMPDTGSTTLTNVPASIGAYRWDGADKFYGAMKASRAASGVVTRTEGYEFDVSDVGRRLFWADGTYDRIISYTDTNTVTVDSATVKTATGAAISPKLRSFTDNVSDDTLRNRAAGFLVPNRTWEALPTDSSCGVLKNGFLVTAPRDGTVISYGYLPNNMEYLMGYYDSNNQVANTEDKIRHMIALGDYLIVFCSHSIVAMPLNTFTQKTLDKIAMISIIIASQTTVTEEIGCMDYGSVKVLGNKTQAIFRANDQSYRMITASSEGITISENLGRDRMQKNHFNKLIGLSSNSYDKTNGYIANGSNVKI